MAEQRKAPDAPDAARKRKAPTIDLTATDVTPQQPAPEPEQASTAEPSSDPASAAPSDSPPEPPPPPDTPPSEEPQPADATPAAAPAREDGRAPIGAMIAAGIAGGVIVAAAIGGLWYASALPSNRAQVQSATETSQQIAQLKQQVDALQNRPTPAPSVDQKTVDALARRVTQIETTLKKPPTNGGINPQLAQKLTDLQSAVTPLAQRLASAESAIKSGDIAVSTLNKRIDDIAASASQARQEADAAGKAVTQMQTTVQDLARNQASTVTRADVDALRQKLTSLEQAEQSARTQIAQSAAATGATRLALAAQALRNAVAGGAPYQAELEQAKALGADADRLAPLQPFAADGVPSPATLSRQLHDLIPQIRTIAVPRPQASGSFLERLQANASKLVRISPVNAPAGDAPADVLARLEAEAARDDIAAAAADIAKLPDAAQAPAKDWVARVKARQAALAAAAELAADTARALKPVAQ